MISGQDIQQGFFHPLGCIENVAIDLKGMLTDFQAQNVEDISLAMAQQS